MTEKKKKKGKKRSIFKTLSSTESFPDTSKSTLHPVCISGYPICIVYSEVERGITLTFSLYYNFLQFTTIVTFQFRHPVVQVHSPFFSRWPCWSWCQVSPPATQWTDSDWKHSFFNQRAAEVCHQDDSKNLESNSHKLVLPEQEVTAEPQSHCAERMGSGPRRTCVMLQSALYKLGE